MNCEAHLNDLLAQFRLGFKQTPGIETTMWDEICKLDTPFVFPDNSPISFYFETDEVGPMLTDRGEASDHLFLSGVSRKKIGTELETIRNTMGLADLEDEICIRINADDPRSAIAVAVNATQILVSSALLSISSPTPRDEFQDAVASFLQSGNVIYDRDVDVVGKTQDFQVDFMVTTGTEVQLPIWTFDPQKPSASRRVRDLYFWTSDIERAKKHPEIELEPAKVLVKSGINLAPRSSAQKSLLALESYLPSSTLIHLDSRDSDHHLDHLLGRR